MSDFSKAFGAVVVIIATIVFCVSAICAPFAYVTSKHEALLYNQKFGTSYTTSQFFWAGDTIKNFLNEGKQETQHIEIKGSVPVTVK